jgi:hypothetical protein
VTQEEAVAYARSILPSLLRAAHLGAWAQNISVSDDLPHSAEDAAYISGLNVREGGMSELRVDGPWAEDRDALAGAVAYCIAEITLWPLAGVKNMIDLLLPEGDVEAEVMTEAIYGAAYERIAGDVADQLLRSIGLPPAYQGAVLGTALTS